MHLSSEVPLWTESYWNDKYYFLLCPWALWLLIYYTTIVLGLVQISLSWSEEGHIWGSKAVCSATAGCLSNRGYMQVYQSFLAVHVCIQNGTYWEGCRMGSEEAETASSGVPQSYDVYWSSSWHCLVVLTIIVYFMFNPVKNLADPKKLWEKLWNTVFWHISTHRFQIWGQIHPKTSLEACSKIVNFVCPQL